MTEESISELATARTSAKGRSGQLICSKSLHLKHISPGQGSHRTSVVAYSVVLICRVTYWSPCSMHWSSLLRLVLVSVLHALVILCGTPCTGLSAQCSGHHLWCSMRRPRRSMPWSSSAALSVPVSVLTALAIISGAQCTGLSAQCTGPHPLCHPPISALNALVIICCIMYLSQRSMH